MMEHCYGNNSFKYLKTFEVTDGSFNIKPKIGYVLCFSYSLVFMYLKSSVIYNHVFLFQEIVTFILLSNIFVTTYFFEDVFSKYQCGFRKDYSAQHCLLIMIEKWKKIVDCGGVFGALLTELSKAFDCIPQDLIIAKLEAYGFQTDALNLVYDYLSNRKQRVKINETFSC